MTAARAISVFLTAASAAWGADLNLTIQSGGSSAVMAAPGQRVDYVVIGQLTDSENDGLALFAFDLEFSGGPLGQAAAPLGPPIDHFANDKGINNPAGFGGTPIEGRLVQVGGGQNTIKNTIEYAPYPIGEVVTGIGHDPIELVSGYLVAPAKPGMYVLLASNVVANAIKPGQDAGAEFWQVEAAGAGQVVGLNVEVIDVPVVAIVSSTPPTGAIDARQPSAVDGSNPGGWDGVLLNLSGDLSALTAADFAVTTTSGKAPGIAGINIAGQEVSLMLDGFIPAGSWTTFAHIPSGTSVRLGFLPADVNNDKASGPLDILDLIDGLNEVDALEIWQSDINRSGVFEPNDILTVIDLLNGAGAYEVWNARELPD